MKGTSKTSLTEILDHACTSQYFDAAYQENVQCFESIQDWFDSKSFILNCDDDEIGSEDKPLILVVPAGKLKFVPEKASYCGDQLHIVNREDSFEQLMKISYENDVQLRSKGPGSYTKIPFSDGHEGIGKTAFGEKIVYLIQKELSKGSEEKLVVDREFLEYFKYADYIRMSCTSIPSCEDLSDQSQLLKRFRLIALYWIRDIHLFDVSKIYQLEKEKDPLAFFDLLTQKQPLILFFDMFQGLFENRDKILVRDCFLSCLNILQTFKILVFVAVERCFDFEYDTDADFNTARMTRISLRKLEPEYIKEIIKSTVKIDNDMIIVTIQEYLNLNDDEVSRIANDIYKVTFGNSRRILYCLKSLEQKEKEKWGVEFFSKVIEYEYYKHKAEVLVEEIFSNIKEAKYFYEQYKSNNHLVNICEYTEDGAMTYEKMAKRLCFYWDGDRDKATLYLNNGIKPYFQVFPLNAPIEILEHASALELVLLQAFSTYLGNGDQKLNRFFQEGKLAVDVGVQLDKNGQVNFKPIPKLPIGTRKSFLLEIMKTECSIYYSLQESRSSDFIIVSKDASDRIFVIGLKVEYFGKYDFGFTDKMLENEIKKFTKMFDERHKEINKILIICSTKHDIFFDKKFYKYEEREVSIGGSNEKIDVYRLKLSREHLSKFLQLENNPKLFDQVSRIIDETANEASDDHEYPEVKKKTKLKNCK